MKDEQRVATERANYAAWQWMLFRARPLNPDDCEVQGLQVTVATVFLYCSRLHRFVVLLGGFVVVDCRSITPAQRSEWRSTIDEEEVAGYVLVGFLRSSFTLRTH